MCTSAAGGGRRCPTVHQACLTHTYRNRCRPGSCRKPLVPSGLPGLRREAGDVEVCLEPEVLAHGRPLEVSRRRRVGAGPAKCTPCACIYRKPDGALICPTGGLVISDQRQDPAARPHLRRSSRRSKCVRSEIEHRSGPGLPAPVRLRPGVPHLVQHTRVAIQHQDMAVAGAVRTTFNERGAGRNGVGSDPSVLVRVIECDRHVVGSPGQRCRGCRWCVPQAHELALDRRQGRWWRCSRRTWVDRHRVDAGIPDIVDRKIGTGAGHDEAKVELTRAVGGLRSSAATIDARDR